MDNKILFFMELYKLRDIIFKFFWYVEMERYVKVKVEW